MKQGCIDKYALSSHCLEEKYKVGEYYVVKVWFKTEPKFPQQPKSVYIPGQAERDTRELDAFLTEWSDTVFREYLGDDYTKYSYLKLDSINRNRSVGITVHILSASELEEVLDDPRVTHYEHIAKPKKQEEISL